MNLLELIWNLTNQYARNNPVSYILLVLIGAILYKGIPFIIKWRKGEIQKDRTERDRTRDTIQLIKTDLKLNNDITLAMKDTLDKHNGNLITLNKEFLEHKFDKSIHIDSKKIERIHERIDDIYEKLIITKQEKDSE